MSRVRARVMAGGLGLVMAGLALWLGLELGLCLRLELELG